VEDEEERRQDGVEIDERRSGRRRTIIDTGFVYSARTLQLDTELHFMVCYTIVVE
jgi:hypothetical protein